MRSCKNIIDNFLHCFIIKVCVINIFMQIDCFQINVVLDKNERFQDITRC